MATPLTRDEYLARWSDLHGGYDPAASRLIAGWLRLVYALARPLAAAGVSPAAVTLLGLLLAAAAAGAALAGPAWVPVAVLAVALSGLLDGLDGAVAVVSGRAGRWGYVLDSDADRLSDAAYLLALYLLGGPGWVCLTAGLLTFLQEYTRARAAAAGMSEIGVVTVAERPTRVIVTAVFVAAEPLPDPLPGAAAGAVAWLGLAVIGLGQLLVVVRRRLAD